MKYQIISERTVAYDRKIISPTDLQPVLSRYAKKSKEHFYVVTLNAAHRIIRINMVSVGILNRTLVHPREVFRPAIQDEAAAVILCHNHPSGDLHPSTEDKAVTERLVDAGELLGITVLDHVVISKKGFYSFTEHGESSLKSNKYLATEKTSMS